jgi:cellulose synthase/poly-beta-1,6-N-acetylglucosamine synthase-like glycosyltransferase
MESPGFMEDVFICCYLVVLGLLSLYGVHRAGLIYLFWSSRRREPPEPERWEELPVVTVQLPMFNEKFVAERLIDAVCGLDYPREKLEIQVLDDSVDATVDIARAAVERHRAEGFDISYLHRTDRTGYKAGALEAGMRVSRGDFVLIFDADFVPRPDIIHQVVHYFTDPGVAMVQTRWGHINKERNLLTRVQSLMLDGHFLIEHNARSRTGRFWNFNGTAGMWRRSAIEDAGGWQHDTVTEDMDLSFRAQLRGWRFVYRPDVVSPAELPEDFNSFKAQQFRWAKGSMQVARKLLLRVLAARIPLKVKVEAFFHLTNNIAYLLMVPLAALILPTILFRTEQGLKEVLLVDLPLFLGTTCAIAMFYLVTYRVSHGRWLGGFLLLPALMMVGIGISLNNARAVLEGFFAKGAVFVRTPKKGVSASGMRLDGRRRLYRPAKSAITVVELLFGTYFALTLYLALEGGHFSAVPFLLLFLLGYFVVGFGSIVRRA